MKEKTIILCGKTCAWKNTVLELLKKDGVRTFPTCTTRPMRKGEKNGREYHFMDDESFNRLAAEGAFMETTEYDATFGHVYYGSLKSDYEKGGAVILNPNGILQLKKSSIAKDIIVIYLDADEDSLRMRAAARGDNAAEIERRLARDKIDFANIRNLYDIRIDETIADTPEKVVETIKECLNLLKNLSIEKNKL